MKFEPKKEIRDIDLTCYTGSSWEIAVMGTNAAYAMLKPFLELQQQMAQEHGAATRFIHFRMPWQFSERPCSLEHINKIASPYALSFLKSMKIKLEMGLAQDSIAIEDSTISVHCGEQAFQEIIATCNSRMSGHQSHGRGFIDVNDGTDGIHCAPLGDWIGME